MKLRQCLTWRWNDKYWLGMGNLQVFPEISSPIPLCSLKKDHVDLELWGK